ncbi:hypothetical protein FJ365_05005 [Candidatus Dependentiae bacterium]|nr:hypothetical protein [Candidatus Dependentiae bacterium]
MNYSHKLALLCTGLLYCSSMVAAGAGMAAQQGALQAKQAPVALKHESMKTINTVFGSNPLIMVSIIKASRTASKTLHDLAKLQEADVVKSLNEIIKPVESFLGMIEGPVGGFIEPLITESFGAEASAKSILGAMTRQKASPLVFLRSRIQSKNDLKQFCQEFTKFFSDLHNSLTPEVRTVINEEMKRLIAQSQAKPVSR